MGKPNRDDIIMMKTITQMRELWYAYLDYNKLWCLGLGPSNFVEFCIVVWDVTRARTVPIRCDCSNVNDTQVLSSVSHHNKFQKPIIILKCEKNYESQDWTKDAIRCNRVRWSTFILQWWYLVQKSWQIEDIWRKIHLETLNIFRMKSHKFHTIQFYSDIYRSYWILIR